MSNPEAYDEDIELIIEDKNGCGGVYLSNIDAARNLKTLQKLNIKAVLSVAKGGFLTHSQQELPNYMYVPAVDHKDFDISVHFQKTFDFIDRNRRKSNVLVHCMAGISRSATIVIAYAMRKFNWSLVEAYKTVKRMRPSIRPNQGFISQLGRLNDTIKTNTKAAKQNKVYHSRNRSCELSDATENKQSDTTQVQAEDKIKPINLEEKINAVRMKFGKQTPRATGEGKSKAKAYQGFREYVLEESNLALPADIGKAKRRLELHRKINT